MGTDKTLKMRASFDLDEVLFVSPKDHKVEEPLAFPFRLRYKERLRLGAPNLIATLQKMGIEVWVYTSSYRSERYIAKLFHHYHVHFDGIINAQRHLREVQRNRKEMLPQKMPNFYHISLHIDDESVICSYGKQYGYDVYQLDADDDEWQNKIIEKARTLQKKFEKQQEIGK